MFLQRYIVVETLAGQPRQTFTGKISFRDVFHESFSETHPRLAGQRGQGPLHKQINNRLETNSANEILAN